MKNLFIGSMFLMLFSVMLITAEAVEVNVNVGLSFPQPPPIVFVEPPAVIPLPDTYAYVVPDLDEDLYFSGGWWWRPWRGRWYRSAYYDRGWEYYDEVPYFYFNVEPGWREYYRNRNWNGRRWDYERIPNDRLQHNWQSWHDDRYWQNHGTWGVQNFQMRDDRERQLLRQQRQQQYHERPEVSRHQQMKQQQTRQQPAQVQKHKMPKKQQKDKIK